MLASRRKTGNLRDHKHFVAHLVEGRLAGHTVARGGLQAGARAGRIGGKALASRERRDGQSGQPGFHFLCFL